MMINKAYEMMESINDIVGHDSSDQQLPNERELKVKSDATHNIQIFFLLGTSQAKERLKNGLFKERFLFHKQIFYCEV